MKQGPLNLLLIVTIVVKLEPTAAFSAESGVDKEQRVKLTVIVEGLKSDSGSVAAALFNTPESYARKTEPFRSALLPIERLQSRWIIEDLPTGHYVIMLYHDRNRNGRLDLSFFRIPTEPYGFSNNADAKFGPPSWETARFRLEGVEETVRIRAR